jgi:hypothetical protein
MKRLIASFLFCLATNALALHEVPVSPVKEHLRLSLWFDGIEKNDVPSKVKPQTRKKLPIEIEKVLVNF